MFFETDSDGVTLRGGGLLQPKKGNMGGGDPEQVKRYLDERREYKRQKRHEREKNLQQACPWFRRARSTMAHPLYSRRGNVAQELAHVKPDVNHRLPFARLGVPPRAAEELEGMGFLEPTEVQERGIPAILSGQHCALLAETGSGKTLAYSLPSFAEVAAASAHKGKVPNHCCPSVIVVVPTLVRLPLPNPHPGSNERGNVMGRKGDAGVGKANGGVREHGSGGVLTVEGEERPVLRPCPRGQGEEASQAHRTSRSPSQTA